MTNASTWSWWRATALVVVWGAAGVIGWYIGTGAHRAVRGPLPSELGVGREQTLGTAGPQEGLLSSSLTSERTASDAHIFQPEASHAAQGDPASAVPVREVSAHEIARSLAVPRDLAPGMLPTADGLYASTVELWSQAEFLLDIGATHLDLPTYDDCERVLRDRCAMDLFTRSQALNIALGVLGQTPEDRRGDAFRRSLENTERLTRDAEHWLMGRLDAIGGYTRWLEFYEKYRSWSSQ